MIRTFVSIALACCGLAAAANASGTKVGEFVSICDTPFATRTQTGSIAGTLSVCHLVSAAGSDSSLYVVSTFEKEYPPHLLRVLEASHSPIMAREGEEIVLLFTSGANTTCVAHFSLAKGAPEYLSTETIAWNDRGTYHTSRSYPHYEPLIEKRDDLRPPPVPTPPPGRPAGERP